VSNNGLKNSKNGHTSVKPEEGIRHQLKATNEVNNEHERDMVLVDKLTSDKSSANQSWF
jgi:hypothetical protein